MARYWQDIHARTVAAAYKAANLETRDKAIMIVIVQALIGLLIFWATHKLDMATRVLSALAPFLLLPVWYVLKFPTMPPEAASEMENRHLEQIAAVEAERDAALAELAEIKKPPPAQSRNPDGIYTWQNGWDCGGRNQTARQGTRHIL